MSGTPFTPNHITIDVFPALSETYLDSAYVAAPALDQYHAVEAYRAFDDGDLEAVPAALAAYGDHHQRQWL